MDQNPPQKIAFLSFSKISKITSFKETESFKLLFGVKGTEN